MKRNLVYIGNHLLGSNKNPTYSLALIGRLRSAGYPVVAASSRANKLVRYLDMWLTLYKNRRSCDYVLIDTYSTWNFYYAITLAWWARRFGLRYIPILHGGNLPVRLKKNTKTVTRYCLGAHLVVCPSLYLAEKFRAAGINNIQVIPNAIDLDKFTFSNRSGAGKNLFWLRSFIPIYNPKLAIEAFKIIQAKLPDTRLTMAGPSDRATLESCKSLAAHYELDIEFKGKLSQQEWIAHAKTQDIFLNTSNFDNMPLSVIEAMAMGLVVVSTNVGGMPFLIEDGKNGLLVRPNDPSALAEAIIDLLATPALMKDLATAARNKVAHYGWEAIIQQWKRVLK